MFRLSPGSFLPSSHVLDADPSLHCASITPRPCQQSQGSENLQPAHSAFSFLAWQRMPHIQAYAGEVSDHHNKYAWCVVRLSSQIEAPPGC